MKKYTAYRKTAEENSVPPFPHRGAAPGLYTADGGFVPWEKCAEDFFRFDGTEITGCGTVPENSDLVIPEGITGIGREAFRGQKLRSVTFPDSLVRIRYGAFSFSGLVSVNFGTGISKIEESAFCGSSVRTAVLPESLAWLGTKAFADCSDLASVCSVRERGIFFGHGVFRDCSSLVSASFACGGQEDCSVRGVFAFCNTMRLQKFSGADRIWFGKTETSGDVPRFPLLLRGRIIAS